MPFKEFIIVLINEIPFLTYVMALLIFCAGLLAFFLRKGRNGLLHFMTKLLLVEYIILVYSSTVIFRETSDERRYNFTPFWSYEVIKKNQYSALFPENVMNVVLFVPIGLLSTAVASKHRFYLTILLGVAISVSIEVLQFVFKKGFSEVDDIMHNTLGCLIGGLMSMCVITIFRLWRSN